MGCFNNIHMIQMALLLMFISSTTCEWPPPQNINYFNNNNNNNINIDSNNNNNSNNNHITMDSDNTWKIASMSYSFSFPLSCNVEVEQTLVMNYTSGTFNQGILVIPQDDYDDLKVEQVFSGDTPITTTMFSDNSFHRIHYFFDEVTAPYVKSFTFKYTAVQATKTFSRSGSSKNSFSWPTVTKNLGSPIGKFDVVLNFKFHTLEDSIDCNPDYSSVILGDSSTTVYFATETDIPENTEMTHQISFPKRITCKPASSYKLIAIVVVLGSILFAVVTAIVALIVRRIKQKNSERFEQLSEVS